MNAPRGLLEAVLAAAVQDVRDPGRSLREMGVRDTPENQEKLAALARAWFDARCSEVGGFGWTCDHLGLDPDAVLRRLG